MKKFLALVMAAAMLLSCVAFAEPTLLADYGNENTLVYAREIAFEETEEKLDLLGNKTNGTRKSVGVSHVTTWGGEYVLVAAYMSEAAIEEFEFEGVEAGFYAVPENAVFLTLEPLFDAKANDPATGPIVDQGNYFHAHVYDLAGTITLPEEIDEDGYTVASEWSEWAFEARGEQEGDFNFGPAKTHIKGEDDFLYWNELTGFDFEEIEEFKYIGTNADGQIIICSATKNIVNSEKAEIMFAYIFDKVVPVEEEAAAE